MTRLTALASVCALLWFAPRDLQRLIREASSCSPKREAFSQMPAQSGVQKIDTEAAYFAALRAADSTTFHDEFEAEFLLLLHEPDKQMYARLQTLAARKDFVERYWHASNPNPLLPQNDWLLDFLQRRAHARKNFPAPTPPFVDDRGTYYLKYGKPLRRYEDFGTLEVLPNETWSYENVTRNFLVHFKREGKIYREAQSLAEILTGRKRNAPDTEAKVLIALARQRTSVSPVFGRVFAKWLDLNNAQLQGNSFANSRTALVIEWQQPHAILFAAAQHAKAEVLHARSVAPVTAHEALHAIPVLALQAELAQFRAADGDTRLEIALLTPLKKKFVRKAQDVFALEYRAQWRDATFNLVSEARATRAFAVSVATANDLPSAVGTLVLTANPQEGDLTLQVKDEYDGRLGFVRKGLTLRDFSGAALMLSDLQLLLEVAETHHEILPTTMKQDRLVAPYPFDEVRKTLPLLCYFEIYNLRATSYALTYEVTAVKERAEEEQQIKLEKNAPTISVTTNNVTSHEFAAELLALDLSQLKKGDYLLEISVTESTTRATHARKKFVIAD